MQSISPNYNWENGVKQIILLKKICHKSCILCQLLRTKTLASGSKCIKHFFYFYHYLPYICWVDVIYLTCLVFLKSPWWLVWIFCAPTPLTYKIKLRKWNMRKCFMGHQKFWKIFHDPSIYAWNISWPPQKPSAPHPPSYILNVWSLRAATRKNETKPRKTVKTWKKNITPMQLISVNMRYQI